MVMEQGKPTANKSDVAVPSTPPSQPIQTSANNEMTPPPSTQQPKSKMTGIDSIIPAYASSPQSTPPTIQPSPGSSLPTLEDIAHAEPQSLRNMARQLVTLAAEARMSAAHLKLQNHLLAMEREEAAQRAEVEHQMKDREVEALQATEHCRNGLLRTSPDSQRPARSQPDYSRVICKELEEDNANLERRLQSAKKIIERETGKAQLLRDENIMLKGRIRENREHFTMLRQSPAFAKPRDHSAPCRQKEHFDYPHIGSSVRDRTQDPLAALLAADQVLSGDVASLPSTPSRKQTSPFRQRHIRGALSLSALPLPSQKLQSPGARGSSFLSKEHLDGRLPSSVPHDQAADSLKPKRVNDRDSTISVSDEDALTEEDIPQSQASSLATNMLRQIPMGPRTANSSEKVEASSKLLQSKLFGPVKKPGLERKRRGDVSGRDTVAKRTELQHGVGLGIRA